MKHVDSHRFTYAVLYTPAAERGYVVTCRDLPALITQGEDRQNALAQAIDAMMLGQHDFPMPNLPRRSEVRVAPPAAMAAARYMATREAGHRA